MRIHTIAALLVLLTGCSSTPPPLETGVQCMRHGRGTATVTATGIVVNEGRCTEWRVGPTKRESDLWDSQHRKGAK